MDPASIAAAFVSQQQGQLQMALAAKFLKMKADDAVSVVQMIDAAALNPNTLANLASGIGQSVDVSA